MIIVSGMMGIGKTTVSKILSEQLNLKVFYENVDNPILPLFYSSTEEEIQKNRYSFLLQILFLNNKIKLAKDIDLYKNFILDRSIYEDLYFCRSNMELGRISKIEMDVYESLFNNLVDKFECNNDIYIYLKGSFETILERIKLRGRHYEIDESLKKYYRFIWEGYDNWFYDTCSKYEIITIDVDKIDILNDSVCRESLVNLIKNKLHIDCK